MPKKKTKPDTIKILNKNIEILNEHIERSNSIRWEFVRGMAKGVGIAIGATLIGGIMFSLLSQTFEGVKDLPIIGEFIPKAEVSDHINESQ